MRGRRAGPGVAQVGTLVVLWVLLWGHLSVANVVSGLVVAAFLAWLLPMPSPRPDVRLRVWALPRFVLGVGWDLLASSVQVVYEALRIGREPVNAVIAVPLRTRTDLTLTITALVMSIVPGTVVVEVRHATGTLFLHVLGVRDLDRARRSVWRTEELVVSVFGTRTDLAAVRDGHAGGEPGGGEAR